MKRPFVLTLLLCILSISGAQPTQPAASQDGIDVYFSPDGGAGHAVVKEIAGAKTSLDIAACTFCSSEARKSSRRRTSRTLKNCLRSPNGTRVNETWKWRRSLLMPSPSKLGPTDDSRLMLPPFAKTLEPLRIVIVFDCVSYPTEPLQPLLRCLDLRLLIAFLTHGDLRG